MDTRVRDFLDQATSLNLKSAPLFHAIIEIKRDRVHLVHHLVGQRLRELGGEQIL